MARKNMPDARRCTARRKHDGERCEQWAVKGSKVCRYHGGKGQLSPRNGRPLTHGRYSMRLEALVGAADAAERLAELEADPNLLDMGRTIAMSQLMIELYLPTLTDEALRQLLKRRYAVIPDYEPSEADILELRGTLLRANIDALTKHAGMQAQARRTLTQEQLVSALVIPVINRLGHDFMAIVAQHTKPEQLEAIREAINNRSNRAVVEVAQVLEEHGK